MEGAGKRFFSYIKKMKSDKLNTILKLVTYVTVSRDDQSRFLLKIKMADEAGDFNIDR